MNIEKFISKKPFVIAGPCSAESEEQVLKIAHEIKNTTDVFRAGVWKPRTKPNSFEGRGAAALNWLKKVQQETHLKVATDLLIHVVDIASPYFQDHIEVVNQTLASLQVGDKPTLLVFNKIDSFNFIKKDDDDLTPVLPENLSLEDLQKTWMAKMEGNAMFISALNKTHFDELKDEMYSRIKQLHEIRYPYNNFLY